MAQDTSDLGAIRANVKVHSVTQQAFPRRIEKYVEKPAIRPDGSPVLRPDGTQEKVMSREFVIENELDWLVEYSPGTDSHLARIRERWSDLQPDERASDPHSAIGQMSRRRFEAIQPYVEAAMRGAEVPVQGTPLGLWAGLDQRRGEILRQFGIRTVEEFLAQTEGVRMRIQNHMPDVDYYLRLAKRFLEAKGRDEAAAQITARDEEIAALRSTVSEMQAMMQRMLSQQMATAVQAPAPDADDDGELEALRDRARRAGIPRAGNKSAETLRAELAEAEQVAA